jgi:hypothetical protein
MPCEDCSTDDLCRCGPGETCGHCFEGKEPKPCQHPNKQYTGALYDGPGGCKTWLYYTCPDCKVRFKEEQPEDPPLTPEEEEEAPPDGTLPCTCSSRTEDEEGDLIHDEGCEGTWPCGDCGAMVSVLLNWCPKCNPLPPEDEGRSKDCAWAAGCRWPFSTACEHGCRWAADELSREANEMGRRWAKAMGDDEPEGGGCAVAHPFGKECPCPPSCGCCLTLPPPEGPEYTPCGCGHIQPEHEPAEHAGESYLGECRECDCSVYRTKPDFEIPPQPDRRPPIAVVYSVQGHLYEVAVSGDASVRAVDGALVIQHHLGPVAGICQVLPIINEESA